MFRLLLPSRCPAQRHPQTILQSLRYFHASPRIGYRSLSKIEDHATTSTASEQPIEIEFVPAGIATDALPPKRTRKKRTSATDEEQKTRERQKASDVQGKPDQEVGAEVLPPKKTRRKRKPDEEQGGASSKKKAAKPKDRTMAVEEISVDAQDTILRGIEVVEGMQGVKEPAISTRKRRVPRRTIESDGTTIVTSKLLDSAPSDIKATLIKSKRTRGEQAFLVPGGPRADIAGYLDWCRGGTVRGAAIGDSRRMNVTSDSLVDDIIERLKPSLDKHRGCDIVDINPGAGLFSAKIHDYLQARSHILLEPDQEVYGPLLQPLLDAPGSKYTLIPKSGLIWGHLEKVLDEHYLPHQEIFKADDPRLDKPNDTLLVIANLATYPRKAYRGFSSLAALVVHQLFSAIHSHSLFQQYGLVRMLIWADKDDTDGFIPKSVFGRRKSVIESELVCESITEVASATTPPGRLHKRERYLDILSGTRVLDEMQDAGVIVPSGRESDLTRHIKEGRTGEEKEHNFPAFLLDKLSQLQAKFDRGEIPRRIPHTSDPEESYGKGMTKKWRGDRLMHPEYRELKMLQYRYETIRNRKLSGDSLIDDYMEIRELQRKLLEGPEAEKQDLEEIIKIKAKEWTNAMEEENIFKANQVWTKIGNRLALETDPPLLQWDRRTVEPLKSHPHEFYPDRELSLFDIQPKAVWPVLREKYPENMDILQYMLSTLFLAPKQSVKKAIKQLTPGAYELFLEKCPSLTDPRRGGNMDLDLMPVRGLTIEMIREMIEAWTKWPFRPEYYEVVGKMGSGVYDETDDPGERLN